MNEGGRGCDVNRQGIAITTSSTSYEHKASATPAPSVSSDTELKRHEEQAVAGFALIKWFARY
jgi:hypothetical protein